MLEKLNRLKGLFFNTPLVAIDFITDGIKRRIYAKYEALSFSGSIKDRMAYYLFEKAYEEGKLKKGQPIVEVTSGNTGIALSLLGRALGHQVHIVMPDWLSKERYQLMKLAGAEIIKVSDRENGFYQSMQIAKMLAETENMYYPDQFANITNTLAHKETTAAEINMQLGTLGLKLDRFVAAIGSGGTVMGVYEYYKDLDTQVMCHPLELDSAPILSSHGARSGSHSIQGFNGEFLSELVNLDKLDAIISVDEKSSLSLSYHLNRLGLSVGLSSGANVLGAIKLKMAHPDQVIVTTLADSALKYLSSDLCNSDTIGNYLPSHIQLIGFSVLETKIDDKTEIVRGLDVQLEENTLQ